MFLGWTEYTIKLLYQHEVSVNKVTHLSCCLENSCNNFLIKCAHLVDIRVIIITIYCYLSKHRIPSVQKSTHEYKAQAKRQHILMQTYKSFIFLFVDVMAVRCWRHVHDLILLTPYQMMILFRKICDNISPALRFTTDKIAHWHTSYPSTIRTTGQLQFRVKNVNTFIRYRYLATLSMGNGDCFPEKSSQGMKPITDLPLVLTIRMSGMIPPLPYMSSSYEQKQLYLYFFNSSNVNKPITKLLLTQDNKGKCRCTF